MKKAILTGLIAALGIFGVSASSFAVQTIDSAHKGLYANSAKESCDLCHFSDGKKVCEECHVSGVWSITNKPAPTVATHGGAAPVYDCRVCHNPHVSLQDSNSAAIPGATPLVEGTIAIGIRSIDPAVDGKDSITFNISGVTQDASYPNVAADWADLTLWVPAAAGNDSYAFSLMSSSSGSLVADGGLPWICPDDSKEYETQAQCEYADAGPPAVDVCPSACAELALGSSFSLQYGNLIARRISAPQPYELVGSTSGTAVTLDGPGDFTKADNTGVCQVCHTGASGKTLAFWTSTSTGDTHNVGARCTNCHQHTSGFLVTACNACHGQSSGLTEGHPRGSDSGELAGVAAGSARTLSVTTGAHAVHVDDYAIQCESCHTGTGMTLTAPNNIIKNDGLQIGFQYGATFDGTCTTYDGQVAVDDTGTNPPGAGYTGENGTAIASPVTGAMSCSNVYCHSEGRTAATRLNCPTPALAAGDTVSPSWDWNGVSTAGDPQGDNTKCNNCHGYTNQYGNTILSGNHLSHVQSRGYECFFCHSDTVQDAGDGVNSVITPVAGYANHVNGSYELKGGGQRYGVNISFTYNTTTHTCGPVTGCHDGSARSWGGTDTDFANNALCKDPATCVTAGANIDPVADTYCYPIGTNTVVVVNNSTDADYNDPDKAIVYGGHDGSPGLMNMYWPGKAAPNDYMWQSITDTPQAITHVRTLKTAEQEDINADGPISGYNAWYIFAQADNHPGSVNNMLTTPRIPGGWAESIWASCQMATGSDPVVNDPVILDFTSAWLGGNTIQITDNSLDPDWDDAGKGHNPATSAYIGVYYNSGGVQWYPFIIDNDPGTSHVIPAYDYPEAIVDTLSAGNGDRWVWWNYTIYENHYYNVGDTGINMSTGWQFTVLK